MVEENRPISQPVSPDWNAETGTPSGHIGPLIRTTTYDQLRLLSLLAEEEEKVWADRPN